MLPVIDLGLLIRGVPGVTHDAGMLWAAFKTRGVAPRPPGQHGKCLGLLGDVPKVATVQSASPGST